MRIQIGTWPVLLLACLFVPLARKADGRIERLMHSHLLACGITFHLFYLFLTYRVVWKPSFYSKSIFAATSLCLSISTLEQHSGPLHLLDGKTIELYNWRYHSKCHLPSSLSFSMSFCPCLIHWSDIKVLTALLLPQSPGDLWTII